MSPRLLLAAALLLPLSACGGDDAADTTAATTPATNDAMADDAMSDDAMTDDAMSGGAMADGAMADDVTVDGTVSALGTDATALPIATATANIDGWIAKLSGAEFAEADDIVTGLRELRTELNATPLDGADIGETLSRLGVETTAAAANASSSSQAGLRRLGETLTSASRALGGSM